MVIPSNKEVNQLQDLLSSKTKEVNNKATKIIIEYLLVFYDQFCPLIFEHLKFNYPLNKFDENDLKKSLDISPNLFKKYKLILKKENIIFQTNRSIQVSQFRKTFLWTTNNERTILSMLYKLTKIKSTIKNQIKVDNSTKYLCTNNTCQLYNQEKTLVEILLNIQTSEKNFNCSLCNSKLSTNESNKNKIVEESKLEELKVQEKFIKEIKIFEEKLISLAKEYELIYELKNQLEKAKYDFEMVQIQNYGKHKSESGDILRKEDNENNKELKEKINILIQDEEEEKIKKVKTGMPSNKFYVSALEKEFLISDISDKEIDKMTDKEYENYCDHLTINR